MRINTKGPKVGTCNICGTHGLLTEDHIPPKGASRLKQVEMINIVDLLSVERPKKSARFSQNGVSYYTLCGKCNNERLGHGYDPTLITLSKDIRVYLESALYLPARMNVKTKPNRLIRSVVGHLLAHGIGEHRNGSMIEELTDYFLNENLPFPSRFKLYYWIYPYNDQVIIKSASMSPHNLNSFAVFMLLKFFPISFFFVLDEPNEWRIPFERLDTMLSSSIDDETEIPISFTNLPPQRWPEVPDKAGMVMHNMDTGATGAIPRAS